MRFFLDADNPVEVAKHCNNVRRLKGKWRGEYKRYRNTRSNKQNNAYHDLIVPILADWITENYGTECTHDEAHNHIKQAILSRSIVSSKTGEIIQLTASTTELDTMQFWDFFEKARELVEELTGCPKIPDPDPAYAKR